MPVFFWPLEHWAHTLACRCWDTSVAPQFQRDLEEMHLFLQSLCDHFFDGFDFMQGPARTEDPGFLRRLCEHVQRHIDVCSQCPAAVDAVAWRTKLIDKWETSVEAWSWHWWFAAQVRALYEGDMNEPAAKILYICHDFEELGWN